MVIPVHEAIVSVCANVHFYGGSGKIQGDHRLRVMTGNFWVLIGSLMSLYISYFGILSLDMG